MLFVLSRFYCRARVTRNLWWDDWCILAPLIFITAASSTISVYSSYGGTRHVFDLEPVQIAKAVEWNLVSLVFCIMAISTGKVSVALLIYRLQAPSKWRTWLLGFLSGSSLLVAVLIIGLEYAQCTPTEKLWIPTLPGSCWDAKKINNWDIAGSCYWALVDLLLAIVPISFLWNLQMSLGKKAAICGLLGLGLFAAICGAIKTSYLPTLTAESDITWITISLLVWNVTEANVIIYAACLPTIRPLFRRCFGGTASHRSTTGEGSAFGRHSGGTNKTHQHIKLGSIGTKTDSFLIKNSGGSAGDWNSKGDSDSDKAHILRPDRIAGSVRVEVQSQDEEGVVRRQESWVGNLERGAEWERSAA
ncbi:hypothetical protein MMC30_007375 [Trapelia coarctata]|nr:hypothetical protein [Trapelia coarctata]